MRKFLAAFWVSLISTSSPIIWAQTLSDIPQASDTLEVPGQDSTATDTSPTTVNPNRVGDKVTLRTLDKITAITRDFKVAVGDSLTFGTLTIDVKHCEVKPPESIPETFAFVQIFEPPQDRKSKESADGPSEPVKLFSGWMLASKPAISALEHGVYDVWVVGCQGGEIR